MVKKVFFFPDEGIPGLYIGMSTMRRGEKARFLLTPFYAFKDIGVAPRVPPNSTGVCIIV